MYFFNCATLLSPQQHIDQSDIYDLHESAPSKDRALFIFTLLFLVPPYTAKDIRRAFSEIRILRHFG